MSGIHAKWSPERRKAQAERMRKLNADKTFSEKRLTRCRTSPYRKARLLAIAAAMNEKRAADPAVNARWKAKLKAANAKPKRKKQLKRAMAEISRRPERRQASREHLTSLNKDPGVRRKSTATRRGIDVPDHLLPLWHQVRVKVGAAEARRIIAAELGRAA